MPVPRSEPVPDAERGCRLSPDATRPPGWPDSLDLVTLDRVGSVLDEAGKLAMRARRPCWIVAREQTAGRGRRGRSWKSLPGNLNAALIIDPQDTPAGAALRTFVASLAVLDACERVVGAGSAGDSGFALKWPNDVLLDGGKLAGILLESAGAGRKVQRLAIGIGVNLAEAPETGSASAGAGDASAPRPVSLAGLRGVDVEPGDYLVHLARAYAEWERIYREKGFAPVRDAWLGRAARLGERIVARVGGASRPGGSGAGPVELAGRFETVDEAGNLVLDAPGGRVAIAAADVFF